MKQKVDNRFTNKVLMQYFENIEWVKKIQALSGLFNLLK